MFSSNGIPDQQIVDAVNAKELDMRYLDKLLKNPALRPGDSEAGQKAGCGSADYEEHHALARRAATEGAVLLKNRDNILPLEPGAELAVIGQLAKEPRYQGSGSSRVNPRKLVSFCDCLDTQNIAYAIPLI